MRTAVPATDPTVIDQPMATSWKQRAAGTSGLLPFPSTRKSQLSDTSAFELPLAEPFSWSMRTV